MSPKQHERSADGPGEPGNDPPVSSEEALARAVAEYVDRQAREEAVDVESFCRSHAALEPELRPLLEALSEIDRVAAEPQTLLDLETEKKFPKMLSGHKILGEIGSGGMGRVFLAYDERLGRKVAIKTLSSRYESNASVRARFMREARALAQLSHPNIVHIYSLGQPGEPPHFVMEYLEGTTLLEAAKALTLAQKAELMHKVVLAVDFLHQHHILHRDLKPGNILVGPDLEPKLLDFGLARHVDASGRRITIAGDVMGTPSYFSPEHTHSGMPLDVRSDVFSLGTVLYELLTGVVPFRGETLAEQIERIRKEDPVLPRRLNPDVPGDLQNICLKALEKKPKDRYGSAREMADDLERYLAGERVHAAPTTYSHLIAGKIDQHLRELEGWRQDEVLSDYEYDSFRKHYNRLIEREDAWILEARRLSLPQVTLYLGAWVLIVGAALLFLFRFLDLTGTLPVVVAAAVTSLTAWRGLRLWRDGQLRVGIAYLLAACLLLPITLLVAMGEYHIFAKPPNPDWELLGRVSKTFKETTNAQLWWAILVSLPAYLWLRRFTRSSVFSLVFAGMGAQLSLVTLLRMGLLDHLDGDPGWLYFRLIPVALLFFITAFVIERLRFANDSRYFYPIAVFFTFVALSGLAGFHKPYQEWLEAHLAWTRGQVEYLFILNAGIYLVLQGLCERLTSSQMRAVAKAFRFVIPGHLLTSLFLLGLEATRRWEESAGDLALKREARAFEILLPLAACLFVYGSIRKQMKNFFVTGLLFLAIGIVRLQQDLFKQKSLWPITLLIVGLLLMTGATKYAAIKMMFARLARRRS